jgi:hypothetical protein
MKAIEEEVFDFNPDKIFGKENYSSSDVAHLKPKVNRKFTLDE